MKHKLLPIITVFLVFALILAGCSSAPAAAEQSAEEPAAAPVETLEEPTAVPTEVWEPIPCNVVFDSDRDGNREIYIMGPDGENPINLTNSPTDDWNPAVSPDGSQIAFVSFREDENGGGQYIYVMDTDGSDVRQLTFEENCEFPDWSHDGKMIVYTSNEDIYTINSDGSGTSTRLTDTPEKDVFPTWSPDGSQIAWLSGQDDVSNIFVMNADSGNILQITDNGSVGNVEWTVDGRIFTSSWGWKDQEEFCHNCVVNPDGTDIVDAGGKGEIQRYLPFWNGADDRVELISGSQDGGPSEIYLVGEVFPDIFYNMTNNPAEDLHPDWPANCGPEFSPTAQAEPAPQPEQAEPAKAEQAIADQDIIIGYEGDPNAMTDQKLADLKQACDELGIQCVEGGSISELAEQGVDAIISFSNIWGAMGDWPEINAIALQGFPIYVLDAETTESLAINLAVESDWVHASLQWMFEQMGDSGRMVYFNIGASNFYEDIIQEELENHPGIQVTSIPINYEDQSSASGEKIAALVAEDPALGAIWSSDPLVDIFWGLNDLPGDQYPAILCSAREDDLQNWKVRTVEQPVFKCLATIKPGGTAYEAVYVAYYRLTGMEIDPAALGGEFGNTLLYDDATITNDNLDEWLGKIGELRMNEGGGLVLPPMTPEEIRDKWFLD